MREDLIFIVSEVFLEPGVNLGISSRTYKMVREIVTDVALNHGYSIDKYGCIHLLFSTSKNIQGLEIRPYHKRICPNGFYVILPYKADGEKQPRQEHLKQAIEVFIYAILMVSRNREIAAAMVGLRDDIFSKVLDDLRDHGEST